METSAEKSRKTQLTLGGQFGDKKSYEAVFPEEHVLRELIETHCTTKYASDIDEFVFLYRVDGDIWYWKFEGCKYLRLMKKLRYIVSDIGIPRHRWENVQPIEIRRYLVATIEDCLRQMVAKLKKEKIAVDDNKLFEDFAMVEQEYLAGK
jgi:hypothetical protein